MSQLVETHRRQRRKGYHKKKFPHHARRIHGYPGTNKELKGRRNQKRCQKGVSDDQRQGQRAVSAVNRHPHKADHGCRHGKFQHHTRDEVVISRKEQVSQAAGQNRQQHMEHAETGQQGKRPLQHPGHIVKIRFQSSREGHKGKHQGNIRQPMLRDIRKKHTKKKTGRCNQRHPFFYKLIKFTEHISFFLNIYFL